MLVQPEIRFFIPCWKEPTVASGGPCANEIISVVRPKKGHDYPVWQRPFFLLALMTNLHGTCEFRVELRLDELEDETLIHTTEPLSLNLGNDPLRIQPVSIMMKAAKLPRRGVYHVYLIWSGQELSRATIHAR